jgi:hypothetical protein
MRQPVPTFEGDILEGKLRLSRHVKESIARWCRTFKTGTHVDITIRAHKSKRSNDQNAYYWGVVVPILADHFGYEPEEIHEELKILFNPIESKIRPGQKIGGSTTKMSTVEFFSDETSYVERICRWAASEYGVYIPPPNEGCKDEGKAPKG